MFQDLRLALRALAKTPAFTLIALLTLALGIGINASMYTLVDVLLFRRAPYPDEERLVCLLNSNGAFSFTEVDELRQHAAATAATDPREAADRPFASLIAYTTWNDAYAEPGRPAERLFSIDATADFFTTFGVQPLLGRAYTAEEELPGHNQVALLGYELWQSHFGGDPAVVGRVVRLNSEAVTIIGVMPESFSYPLFWGRIDLWRPVTVQRQITEDRSGRVFGAIGRLRPGVSPEQAAARLAPVLARWAHDYPQLGTDRTIELRNLHKLTTGDTGRFLAFLLSGIGTVVLLLVCFNLANLQLARAAANTRELAIRSALGASRFHLVRYRLVESMVLALAGGALGLLVAVWTNALVGGTFAIGDGVHLDLTLDRAVLGATVVTAVLCGLLFGALPAWLASRGGVNALLRQQSRGATAGVGFQRFRHGLIVVEVALSLALLATAGIMLRGLDSLLHRKQSWDTDRILAANIHLAEGSVYDTREKRRVVIEKLARRLAEIPRAEHTTVCTSLPLYRFSKVMNFQVQGVTSDNPDQQPVAGFTMVDDDYFATFGIPLLEGRLIPPGLTAESAPVVVVNESLARHFWPGRSAIGQRIGERFGDTVIWREVIGVVRDIRFTVGFGNPSTSFQIYKPLVHEPWGFLYLVVRADRPAALKNDLRRAIADVDPDIAVQSLDTMPEAVARFSHNIVVINRTLAAFALLGLLFASVGFYGVLSILVTQRTNEFGIRLALGADGRQILALVLRQGLRLTVLGLAIGSAAAFAVNLALRARMPLLAGADPLTIGAVALALLLVATLACWLPARRATRVDPLTALRAE